MWMALFIFSFLINIVFCFYIRWLLKGVVIINEDMANLNTLISDFTNHLNNVYDLEMFYGDETLSALLQHSRELSKKLEEVDLIINRENDLEPLGPQEQEIMNAEEA